MLWTLGFSSMGFLLAAAQLWLPVWSRRREERQAGSSAAEAADQRWWGEG